MTLKLGNAQIHRFQRLKVVKSWFRTLNVWYATTRNVCHFPRWSVDTCFVGAVGSITLIRSCKTVGVEFLLDLNKISNLFFISGVTVKLECMFTDCHLICQEEFVFNILSNNAKLKAKYEQLSFRDFIQSHPHLRWCPGRECNIVIYCKTNKAHRVTCSSCTTRFWLGNI